MAARSHQITLWRIDHDTNSERGVASLALRKQVPPRRMLRCAFHHETGYGHHYGADRVQYRSSIRGVARQRQGRNADYCALVRQLMEAGWYRIGQDRDLSGRSWGFRFGHTMPDPTPRARGAVRSLPRSEERWIEARNEIVAMRKMLREVGGVLADERSERG